MRTIPMSLSARLPSRWPALVCLALALPSCAHERDDDLAVQEHELVVCGHGPTVEGIDVSSWQGAIDWGRVAGAGIRFAIVRISDGSYRDRDFATNWAGARAAGLIRGAYQFFEPEQDPIAQADMVVAAVGRLGPGDLPVTIDVEAPSPGVSPAEYTRRIHVWIDRVTAGTGRAPIIYTGRYYWDPYVASSDFASVPLWHAQYTTASCPNINDRWSDWAMWQYTSTGSVAGIAGNVDRNRWNGTMEELAAFAMSNRAPSGYLDAAACDGIRGWAQDPDAPTSPIDVHVYLGGPAGDPAALGIPVHANVHRDDLCAAIGSCEHGFSVRVPLSFFDGADHPVYAYGIDSAGGANAQLMGAPQTLRCDTPPFPMPPAGVVRRHVTSPEVLAAWHLGFVDVAPLADAMLDAIPDGPDLAPAPELVRVEGDPAVYERENDVLRHVTDAASMDAWRFDWAAIAPIDATERDADLRGADWLAAPFLARGSGPAVYLIDAPPPLWAELVTDDVPAQLAAGSVIDATFRFANRGSATWTTDEVALAPTPRDVASELCDPSWPSCTRAAKVLEETAPGEEGVFRVRLVAPEQEGPLTICFGLVLGTHWFSDAGEMGPADDATCRTIEVVRAATADGGAIGPDGGTIAPGDPHDPHDRAISGSCTCRVGGRTSARGAWLALALLAIVLARRRR